MNRRDGREAYGQRRQRAVERAGPPSQLSYWQTQFDIGETIEELLHRGRRDQPGRTLRRTVVRARAPRQVGSVARPLIGRQRRIRIGRGETDDQRIALAQHRSLVPDVVQRIVHGVVGDRRIGPQHLVEGVLHRETAAGQIAREPVVGQQQPQAVRDQVLLGLGAGAHQYHEGVDHLLVGEARGVRHQPGRHVLTGVAPLQRDQVEQGAGQQFVGLLRVHPVEDPGHALDQPDPVLGRAAEEVVEDQQRQDLRVLAEQIRRAERREAIDEGVGAALHIAAQGVRIDEREAVGDRAAQPLVLLAVGEQRVGPVHHHRHDRAVRRDGPVGEVAPAAGVLGEGLRAAQDVQGGVVGGDEGGSDAGCELDRCGRSGRTQPPVDGGGVGRERGPVQGLVRGAARRWPGRW
ncbi:hypothetical protein HEP84_56760 [Streptomyces sp. RLB1-33]